MASDEMLTMDSSSVIDEEYDDGFDHYQTRQSSLSRLSICTSSFHEDDVEGDQTSELSSFVSGMSLENFNDDDGAEADGEESDSDKESSGFYSLPTIISRRRRKVNVSTGLEEENEMKIDGSKCGVIKQRRVRGNQYGLGFNGVERDSDGDGNCYSGGRELTVLTNVKGGKKSMMKMGFEEVKACRDLGFDLEVPGRVLVSIGSNREIQSMCNNCMRE